MPRNSKKVAPTETGGGLLPSAADGNSQTPAGLVVADQPVIDMGVAEITRAMERLSGSSDSPAPFALAPPGSRTQARPAVGMRYLLQPSEGSGYWDFFSTSKNLLVSVTDTTYRRNHWIPVDDSHYFKLRFMLSGRLINRVGTTVLQSGQAVAHVRPSISPSGGGYFVAGGTKARMVILHGRRELLTDDLGMAEKDVPPPLDRMLLPGAHEELEQKVGFGPKVFRAAQDIIESRHELPAHLRAPYLAAKAWEILCQVLAEFVNRDAVQRLELNMSSRELNCIYEARDYLAQHYAAPPTISKLARMVGINQTKLKAGFKQALGMTIYQFIIRQRMERASELLLADDQSISEVAYQVGYDYPANFTYAFKKHYGVLPRAWRLRQRSAAQRTSAR